MNTIYFNNKEFDCAVRRFFPIEAWYITPKEQDPIVLARDLAKRCRALGTDFLTTHINVSYRVKQITGSCIEGVNITSMIIPYFWAWLSLEEAGMILEHKDIADTCILVYEEGFAMLDGQVSSESILNYWRRRKEIYNA